MWQRQARHCPLCGATLVQARIEGRDRLRCSACRFVLFLSPGGASAGLVVDGAGRVLLVQRTLEPHAGSWALPAGYQEIDEEPRQTAIREVQEETGLEVVAGPLLDLFYVESKPRKPANLAVYLCWAVGGELAAGDDAAEARWFPLDELPPVIGFDNRRRILAGLADNDLYRSFVEQMQTRQNADRREHPDNAPGRGLSYADAGVSIDSQDEALARSKAAIRESFTPGVVGDVGLFGGLFDLGRAGCGQGMLVASADGVGTKLEVAVRAGVFDTVGRDLVQHCINDILVQGAKPLFFMDYVAAGKLDPQVIAAVISGCAHACRDNGLALLGGETAEMPGLYADADFDLAGFIVGVVEPDKLLDGSRVRAGQVLLGLRSAGLHTNGYSLARKVLFDVLGLGLDDRPPELGGATVAEALLAEHRSYLAPLWPCLEQDQLAALAHITGGGLRDNLPRLLGGKFDAVVDRDAWEVPGLFRLLVEGGDVAADEAYRTFNMGIGMVLFVEPERVAEVQASLGSRGEESVRIGEVVAGSGKVRWA